MSHGFSNAQVLPGELMVEILSRLPVKELMRFRCISKSLNSLVFDPTMVKLHLQRSSKDTPILFTQSNCTLDQPFLLRCTSIKSLLTDPSSTLNDTNDSIPFQRKYGGIIGVCNGLVCIQCVNQACKKVWVQFWNPATRLRSRNSPSMKVVVGDMKIGFGYDESNDTYKVVAVLWPPSNGDHKQQKIELRVHNLGDNCWRKIAIGDDFPTCVVQHKGEFLNGTINWAAQLASKEYVVFSFDIKNETYQCFSLPVDEWFGLRPMLRVFGGCLCLSHLYNGKHYGLWQMKEFGNPKSWTLLMTVGYDHLLSRYSNFPHPLCISNNNDVLLLINNKIHQLIRYDRRDDEVEQFDISHKRIILNSTNYVQSLVLPYRN
ncbi:F-box/kelch-repeat protein At3g23880 [Cajanus cajan]|uniref:F-box/kelch-repeat protein At3g23880 family n=1 Tax=Cajanus cajan TaxID=3821 RepID=A0A151U5S2_CAJCA|nr:F-box/kelch-repeat protein At3g23880 [Cajanus cajan]KYP74607.1 F-box/kelch-repeat protein At3g23880 family [Cajanus cajan]